MVGASSLDFRGIRLGERRALRDRLQLQVCVPSPEASHLVIFSDRELPLATSTTKHFPAAAAVRLGLRLRWLADRGLSDVRCHGFL